MYGLRLNFAIALILFSGIRLDAAAIRISASVEKAAVQTQVDASSDGDIVWVPAGAASWSDALNIGTKMIAIIGAGIGQTVVTSTRSGVSPLLSITPTTANKFFRLSGISFRGGESWNDLNSFFVSLVGNSESTTNGSFFRIDRCEFSNIHQDIMRPENLLGLVDQNFIHFNSPTPVNNQHHFAFTQHDKWDGGEWGHRSFSQPVDHNGTNFFVYERNNLWINSISGAAYAGYDHRKAARTIIRFEKHTNSWVELHGPEEGEFRASRVTHVYGCEFYTNGVTTGLQSGFMNVRSGTALCVSNVAMNPYPFARAGNLVAYRAGFSNPQLFEGADGTNTWDLNAAGGPFATGTHTGISGATILTDSTKTWSVNQFQGWSIRNITKVQNNRFSLILGNTQNSVTLWFPIFNGPVTFDTGDQYEIWRVTKCLDAPGQGLCDVLTGNPPTPRTWPNQQYDTCFQWGNLINGVAPTWLVGTASFWTASASGNYCNNVVKPGWVPMTYPHPFAATNSISPASDQRQPGEQIDFDMSGGSGILVAFQVWVNNSGASINSASGLYTAGPTNAIDTVRAWDTWGNYADATVTVQSPGDAPTATFSANPMSISIGQQSTLTWTTTGATSVTINGVPVIVSGSSQVGPNITTLYSLVATNAVGSLTTNVTVTVLTPNTEGSPFARIRRVL